MPEIEIHVDHATGQIAVGWPDVPGYCLYDQHHCGEGRVEVRHTVPTGMTRMRDASSPAPACASTRTATVPRAREPRRYHPVAEGA